LLVKSVEIIEKIIPTGKISRSDFLQFKKNRDFDLLMIIVTTVVTDILRLSAALNIKQVITHLENLDKSGNCIVVGEKSEKMKKSTSSQWDT